MTQIQQKSSLNYCGENAGKKLVVGQEVAAWKAQAKRSVLPGQDMSSAALEVKAH